MFFWGRRVEVPVAGDPSFRNATADAQDEYLADGITDALITRLTALKNLSVLSYSMVRRYRGSSQSAAEIGRRLGVDTVLRAAVRRSGGPASTQRSPGECRERSIYGPRSF